MYVYVNASVYLYVSLDTQVYIHTYVCMYVCGIMSSLRTCTYMCRFIQVNLNADGVRRSAMDKDGG